MKWSVSELIYILQFLTVSVGGHVTDITQLKGYLWGGSKIMNIYVTPPP